MKNKKMSKEHFKVFNDRNETSIDFDTKNEEFIKYIDGKIKLIHYEHLQIFIKKPKFVFENREFILLIF